VSRLLPLLVPALLAVSACAPAPDCEADRDADGFDVCSGDCDDLDPDRHPGASERCNGLDDDCDGQLPEEDVDRDLDSWPVCAGDCDDGDAARTPADRDGDGFTTCSDVPDCDDADPTIHPAAVEVCDGRDDDCDGRLLAGGEQDHDGDGEPDCDPCDDYDPWGDGVDSDCDGVDGEDQDGDGWAGNASGPDRDCADDDPERWPGHPWDAPGDGVDFNCDGDDAVLLDDGPTLHPLPPAGSELWRALEGGGDYDGDGRADLVVGLTQEGGPVAAIYRGADLEQLLASGADPDVLVAPEEPTGLEGVVVGWVDDLDGDGRRDLAVGDPGYTWYDSWWQAHDEPGSIRFYGSTALATQAEVGHDDALFGVGGLPTVATTGRYRMRAEALADVDGDGSLDLLLGVEDSVLMFRAVDAAAGALVDVGEAWAERTDGGVRLLLLDLDGDGALETVDVEGDALRRVDGARWAAGGPLEPSGEDRILLVQEAAGEELTDAQPLPDLDGDGVLEVAVGVPRDDGLVPNGGLVCVVSGAELLGGGEASAPCLATIRGSLPFRGFGIQLAAVGDVDGDGGDDLAVVAPAGGEIRSATSLFAYAQLVPGAELVDDDAWVEFSGPALPGNSTLESWDAMVIPAGDLDGDGRADLVLGALPEEWPQATEPARWFVQRHP